MRSVRRRGEKAKLRKKQLMKKMPTAARKRRRKELKNNVGHIEIGNIYVMKTGWSFIPHSPRWWWWREADLRN
jgi:hypothetical protein